MPRHEYEMFDHNLLGGAGLQSAVLRSFIPPPPSSSSVTFATYGVRTVIAYSISMFLCRFQMFLSVARSLNFSPILTSRRAVCSFDWLREVASGISFPGIIFTNSSSIFALFSLCFICNVICPFLQWHLYIHLARSYPMLYWSLAQLSAL